MTDDFTRHLEAHDKDLLDGNIDGVTHLANYLDTLQHAIKPGVCVEKYRYAISAARKCLARADDIDPEFHNGARRTVSD